MNKNVDNSNVQVNKIMHLRRWENVVLLLEWCEMYVENNVPWSRDTWAANF